MPPSKRAKKSSPRTSSKTSDYSLASESNQEECFRKHIYKVLREIYDDTGINKQAMNYVNAMVNELFHVIAGEASKQMKKHGRSCMTAHDIQNAVRKILPGELEKHAVSEGTKAVAKYKNYQSD